MGKFHGNQKRSLAVRAQHFLKVTWTQAVVGARVVKKLLEMIAL